MKVHFIQQDPWVTPGEYLSWAERNGWEATYTRCWRHEAIPQRADADLLVVLGGHQNPATTRAECDYFDAAAQCALIRSYVKEGRMVVGVCLGAQLVGEALGAAYGHSPEKEIGPVKARLTTEGRTDPFLKAFPDAFDAGEWHNDMPGLTLDAAILAESDGCPRQIVRYGRYVYGFQAHMEFTREIVAAGIADAGGEIRERGRFVQSAAELLAWDYTGMNRLLSAFLDAMAADYSARRMEKQLAFALEIDKEKNVFRQTHLSGHGRRENDAEHAWHMAIMAYLLREYANEPVDIARVMLMCLIHDIVEIDAGDTYAYDAEGLKTQKAREDAAKARIFSLLPDDQRAELTALFDEFEAYETAESRFAHSMDNLQPLLLNDSNDGGDWKAHGVTAETVYGRQNKTRLGSERLFEVTDRIIKAQIEKGNLPER